MTFNKELVETDDGKLYYVNDFGEIYLLSFEDKDTRTHEEKMEEIAEVRLDYICLQASIDSLKQQMRESAKEHRIELPTTRKDLIDELREKKNAKRREKKNSLTEDITSEEFKHRYLKRQKNAEKFLSYTNIKEEVRRTPEKSKELWRLGRKLDEAETEVGIDVYETLREYEGKTESQKLPERKSFNLEC